MKKRKIREVNKLKYQAFIKRINSPKLEFFHVLMKNKYIQTQ